MAIHNCPSGEVAIFIRPFLNFCVAMFLFLSGYLTPVEIKEVKLFYKKRILRVLVPYTIWSIIYTIANGDFEHFMINYLTARCCGIYYYIAVYIQLTLLAPFIGWLIRSKYWWFGFIVTPAGIAVEYFFVMIGYPIDFPWNAIIFPVWFLYYYLGMWMTHKKVFLSKRVTKYCICLLTVTILLQMIEGKVWIYLGNFNMATTQIKFTSMFTSIVAVLVAGGWIISSTYKISKKTYLSYIITTIFQQLGNDSFGIYLSHFLVMQVLDKTIYRLIQLPFPMTVILVILVTSLCIYIGRKVCSKKICCWLGLN